MTDEKSSGIENGINRTALSAFARKTIQKGTVNKENIEKTTNVLSNMNIIKDSILNDRNNLKSEITTNNKDDFDDLSID